MQSYTLFSTTFLISAATPGPDVVVVVSKALAGKRASQCLPLILGILAGKLVLLTTALLGLSALATALGSFFVGIKFAGAAYLAYLGMRLWRRPPRDEFEVLDVRPSGATKEVGLGLAMSLGNPVAILFYAALLPNVIDVRNMHLGSAGALAAIVCICTLATYCGYAMLASRVGGLFRSSRGQRRVNRTSGAAMVGAAFLVATR